jgi:transcriptional regulator with XRE-family HTH domain
MADHERLDHAIEARTVELGISYVELAQRAGISDVSLRNFRKGRGNLRLRNQRKLENALGWAPGSIAAILGNGEPATADEPTVEELEQEIADLKDEIEHLEVRYERNRPFIVAHLEQRLAALRARLNAL